MAIIPIQLDDEIIKKIDLLVKQGRYKNRTEALRDQIMTSLDKISVIETRVEETEKYQKILTKLLKMKTPPQFLNTEKSLNELVSENRER